MNEFLKNCEAAARAGGQVLLDWIGHFDTREKARFDMVTDADLASQEVVRGMLLAAYPDHGFLGEEGLPSGNADAEYRWVVDPLDGTTNYIHQIPHYCTSVGLERRGELMCGAVYDPILKECFTAAAGQGAFLNGRRISVSKVDRRRGSSDRRKFSLALGTWGPRAGRIRPGGQSPARRCDARGPRH